MGKAKPKTLSGAGSAGKRGLVVLMQIWSKTPAWFAILAFLGSLFVFLKWKLGYAVCCKSNRKLGGKIAIVTGRFRFTTGCVRVDLIH